MRAAGGTTSWLVNAACRVNAQSARVCDRCSTESVSRLVCCFYCVVCVNGVFCLIRSCYLNCCYTLINKAHIPNSPRTTCVRRVHSANIYCVTVYGPILMRFHRFFFIRWDRQSEAVHGTALSITSCRYCIAFEVMLLVSSFYLR